MIELAAVLLALVLVPVVAVFVLLIVALSVLLVVAILAVSVGYSIFAWIIMTIYDTVAGIAGAFKQLCTDIKQTLGGK